MKRLTAAVGVGLLAGALAFAATNEVTSVNAVGFVRTEIGPGKLALLTLNFESFQNPTITTLIGDQVPNNSNAYIWDRVSNSYKSTNKSRFGVWTGEGATNVILRGDAFWLQNGGSVTSTVAIMGEVPGSYNNGSTSVVENVGGVDAIGYAYPTDVVWTNTALSKKLESNANFYLWDVATQSYISANKNRFGVWTGAGASTTIPAGRAFWVTTTNDIDWSEVAPYTL